MALSLTVLGCSGTYAAPGGACSGYLVRSSTTTVLVDCGPGTLANLQQHVSLLDLDAVVVTHEHGKGEVAVRGPASELFLFLWGRLPLEGGALAAHGDHVAAAAWGTLTP